MNQRLALLAAALWWGSLSALGALVVPSLFAHLPSAALAGQAAAKLFAGQSWLSAACAVAIILLVKPRGRSRFADSAAPEAEKDAEPQDFDQNQPSAQVKSASGAINFAIPGLLLALLLELAIAPRIVARENLAMWHGLGTGMFALQWLMALGVLWRLSARSED